MPLTYSVDLPHRLVRIVATGRPDVESWFAMMESIFAEPWYEPGFDFYVDRSERGMLPTTPDVQTWLRRYCRLIRAHGNGKMAMVVSEPVIYGTMRMAAVFAEEEGVRLAVFWKEADALAWLALDRPHDAFEES